MAISHVNTNSWSFGAAGLTPGTLTGGTDNLVILFVGGKPYNAGLSVDGWTQIGSAFTDGTTAAGNDAGSMFVTAFYAENPGSAPTIVEGSPVWNIVGGLTMAFSKSSSEAWDTPVAVGGGDATSGTGFSVTTGSNPNVTAGDVCLSFAAFQTDAATPCSSHLVATQTGATFTNTHDPGTDGETTTGGDMGTCVNRATVTGTGSAAPVLAATLAAAGTGSAMFIRLRVSTPPPAVGPPYIGGGYYG